MYTALDDFCEFYSKHSIYPKDNYKILSILDLLMSFEYDLQFYYSENEKRYMFIYYAWNYEHRKAAKILNEIHKNKHIRELYLLKELIHE
jgi:hypothetical protein